MDAKASATLDRVAQSLDRLNNFLSRNYNAGRGGVGTSSRKVKSDNAENKSAAADVERTKQIVDSVTAFKMFKEALRGSSRIAEIFTGEVRRIYTEADKVLKEHEDANKQLTEATRKYLETQGLNSKAIYQNSRHFNVLANTARVLTEAFDEHSEQQQILNGLKDQETKLQKERASTTDKDAQKELDKEIKALSKKIKEATALEKQKLKEYEEIYNKRPIQEMGKVFATIDKSHPLWEQLSEGMREWIETGTTQKISYQQLNNELKSLIQNTQIYDETIVAVGRGMEQSLENFQNAMDSGVKSLRAALLASAPIFGSKVLDGVLAQFRYGVSESNFQEALLSGISDPKMSQILGDFQTEMRALAGSTNLVDASDDFRKAVEGSAWKMGLVGDEAADFTANLTRMNYRMGLGSKNIEDFYDGISAISRSAQVTKDEVIAVMNDLQESNILGSMYTDVDDVEKRKKLIQADINALLRHGKALGMTTQQTLAFRKELAGKQFGSLEDVIRDRISTSMTVSSLGLNFDANKISDIQRKNTIGQTLSSEESRMLNAYNQASMRAMAKNIQQTGESGLITKQVIESVSGGRTGFTSENLREALGNEQVQKQAFDGDTAAIKKFMEEGVIPLNATFVNGRDSFEDLRGQVEEVNSSLALFEKYLPQVASLYKGLFENPVFAATVGGGVISALGSVLQTYFMYKIYKAFKFPTLTQTMAAGAKSLWSGAARIFSNGFTLIKNFAIAIRMGLSALWTALNPLAKLVAVGTAAYAAGSWFYDTFLKDSQFFINMVNMMAGSLQAAVGWIQKNVLGLMSDDMAARGEENLRMGQNQMDEGYAYFAGIGADMLEAVGMATPEQAKAAKENVYRTINESSSEEAKRREEERKALDERIVKAVEATAENTKKVADEEEKKRLDEQKKAFQTRDIHSMESALAGINTEISNRLSKYTNVDNY